MNLQTMEQILPLMELLQQPAFCMDHSGTVFPNRFARLLAPVSGQDLEWWLGESAELYSQWDHRSNLVLPVPLGSQSASVTLQPLADGTLFLLSGAEELTAGKQHTAVMAQVLRQPLTELYTLMQTLSESMEEAEDPLLQQQTASITRHIYRLNRIACDLADLEQLQSGTYPARPIKLDLTAALQELSQELTDLCLSAGYRLECRLPDQPILISADPVLLERALLNLLSNAMKYGRKDVPVQLLIDTTPTSVCLRVRNACSGDDCDLLTSAFQRLSRRGLLPDPDWGLGLGLPLVLSIARILGGTVAVEVNDQIATVSMSISRKRSVQDTAVHGLPPYDYTGGMRRSLVELADCLPNDCYDSIFL